MTDPVLHMVVRAPSPRDLVPEFETRCGLRSLHLPDGRFDRFMVAKDEPGVTCPKCRIKLSSVQEKVLRIMLAGRVVLSTGKFQFAAERRRLWMPTSIKDKLIVQRLVRCVDGAMLHELTMKGRMMANALPKVKEDDGW